MKTNAQKMTRHFDLTTVLAIAIVSYVGAVVTHEVVGHGLACLLTDVKIVTISSVAISSQGGNVWVYAAGTIAQVLAAGVALAVFSRGTHLTPIRLCLWIFAGVNLLDATGYLIYSGLTNFGDWGAVIAGQQPAWLFRALLVVVGLGAYVGSVYLLTATIEPTARRDGVGPAELRSMVVPAYIGGSLLLVAASAFNPISPMEILYVGVAESFAGTWALLLVPGYLAAAESAPRGLVPDRRWIVTAAIVAVAFIGVLGHGVQVASFHAPRSSMKA